jgi:diguanylate cyclase (GGDEF)-like protein
MSSPGPIADLPYAAQLQAGFRWLRFGPVLEGEFRSEFTPQHLGRMRRGLGVAMVLYGLFMLIRWRVEGAEVGEWGLILRGAAVAAMLLTLAATWVQRVRPALPYLSLATYAIFAVGATLLEVLAHKHHVNRHYETLILVSFHVYVFGGLLFRPALVGGAIILGSYLVGGWLGGLASRDWAYEVLFVALAQLIGATATYSIERVEREAFLRRRMLGVAATHDSLTGLFNRVAFFHEFERAVKQAARQGAALGVVLLDLDYFKAFNDRYGHLAGDACLRAVAGALREEFKRPLDAVGRYGGEEFVGVWHDIQPQSVRALGDQLRAAVQALKIENRDAPSGRMTASVGVIVCIPQENESLLELIKRADRALYEAKDKGRNRVVVDVLPSAQQRPSGRRAPSISAG